MYCYSYSLNIECFTEIATNIGKKLVMSEVKLGVNCAYCINHDAIEQGLLVRFITASVTVVEGNNRGTVRFR